VIDNYKIDSEVLQSLPSGFTELSCKLARLASLGMLSNRLMHDFRNKLAVISGNIQIVQIKGTDVSPDFLTSRLETAMKMITETLKLFDEVGSSKQRAAGIAMEVNTEKAIKRALAALKHQFEQSGIMGNKGEECPDFTFKGDAGLFDYIIMSLMEMFISEDRIEGEFTVSSVILKNTLQMSLSLHLKENDTGFRESFRKRINSLEMAVIEAGVGVLKGKLKILEKSESLCFELEIPV